MTSLLEENNIVGTNYAEPYAGGAGLALRLLMDEYVNEIFINDLDPSIYAFWYVVLNNPDEMCRWIAEVEISIRQWEESLKLLYEDYLKKQNQLNELTGNKKDTLNQKLLKMETEFSKLANKYGYSSNGRHLLGLLMEEKSGYCYFPIVQYGNNEMIPVRSMSSASDFVRCIWAYYTALLLAAERHPGFLLLDEPCQQSMSEDSLKALFKNCSQIKQKQVLLFCSSSPKTEENEKNTRQKSIDDMLREVNMKEGEDFTIHHISGHSVDELSAM